MTRIHKFNRLGSVKHFLNSEKGVVGLVFAVILPFILTAMYMSFQFDQYNRYLARVEQAQFSALRGAYKEDFSIRKKLTQKLVEMNVPTFKSALNLNGAREDDGYLWSETIIKDKSPLVSFAKDSSFDSNMRIKIPPSDLVSACRGVLERMALDTPTATYKDTVTTCGKLTRFELYEIPDNLRLIADRQALYNIAAAFFPNNKAMTITEARNLLGIRDSSKDTAETIANRDKSFKDSVLNIGTTAQECNSDKCGPNSHKLLHERIVFNLIDVEQAEIRTALRDDTQTLDAMHWMLGDYPDDGYDSDYAYFTQKLSAANNKAEENYLLSHVSDVDLSPGITNVSKKVMDTRFFYSNWMIEKMDNWQNGIQGSEKFRTLRVSMTFEDRTDENNNVVTYVKSVRIRINRSSSKEWNGTHNYDLDVTASIDGTGSLKTEKTHITDAKHGDSVATSGVYRNTAGGDYTNGSNGFTKYYKDIYGENPAYSDSTEEYRAWYTYYLIKYAKLSKSEAENVAACVVSNEDCQASRTE